MYIRYTYIYIYTLTGRAGGGRNKHVSVKKLISRHLVYRIDSSHLSHTVYDTEQHTNICAYIYIYVYCIHIYIYIYISIQLHNYNMS